MKQFLRIKAKPLEFTVESEADGFLELAAHAFGWNYFVVSKGDVWTMTVTIAYVDFYQLECASKEAAIRAANTHFQSHLAEWLEVAE